MANYSTDNDLILYHYKIMDYGISDWGDFHTAAKNIIDTVIDVQWYRRSFPDWGETPFDPDLLMNHEETLARLSSLKVISMAFASITKGDDDFMKLSELFEKRYTEELSTIVSAGFDYDADSSGVLSIGEKSISSGWRLQRA